ncbi:MAG: class I SAM-dependent methyltransferase [Clostridiales bacterium]|nr:class I SAM-dependent methyltransferase [Clostridiales bacterium]
MDNGTGWERHRRTHFNDIVENYDLVRPEYPSELFEDIFKYSGLELLTADKKALEIGAGTGKATSPVLKAGYGVTAVEISENMAAFLLEKYKNYKNFNVIVSTFEDALLAENSCDLIYAASAFHWVDPEIGCPKVFRLLKSGGVFALLRYNFNNIPPYGEKLHEEITAAYEKNFFTYYISENKFNQKKITKKRFEGYPKILSGYGFEDLSVYGFSDITMNLYEATRTYDPDEWIGLLNTLSDHRNLPEHNKTALYSEIKEAIIKNGGQHKLDIVFQLYMGRKVKSSRPIESAE